MRRGKQESVKKYELRKKYSFITPMATSSCCEKYTIKLEEKCPSRDAGVWDKDQTKAKENVDQHPFVHPRALSLGVNLMWNAVMVVIKSQGENLSATDSAKFLFWSIELRFLASYLR